MKTSPAGKVLGPQSGEWEVIGTGDDVQIKTPGGRLLRLQQLHYGRWVPSPFGPSDTKHLVDGANLLREKNAAEHAERERLDREFGQPNHGHDSENFA